MGNRVGLTLGQPADSGRAHGMAWQLGAAGFRRSSPRPNTFRMVVSQPSGDFGLWPRVQALAPWPETNEDVVQSLADELRNGAQLFTTTGQQSLEPVAAAWRDSAGQDHVTKMQGNLDAATRTAGDLSGLATKTDNFVGVVTAVKTDIRDTVERNIPPYGSLYQLPNGVREAAEQLYVDTLADWTNSRVENGASQITGASPANNPIADGIRSAADVLFDARFGAIEALGTDPVGTFAADNLLTLASSSHNLDQNTATNLDGKTPPITVFISNKRYPESAAHITEAQTGTTWRGDVRSPGAHPSQVTIDRAGAGANRRASLRGVPTRTGFDRDEYPPAMFKEGGSGASVKYVPPSDNRGAGASMGNQVRAAEASISTQIDGGAGTVDDLAENRQVVIRVR